MRDRFDDQRVEDDVAALVDVAEASSMLVGECGAHLLVVGEFNFQGRVAAAQAKARAAIEFDTIGEKALLDEGVGCRRLELAKGFGIILAQRPHDARLADRLHVGQTDAIGG